MIEIITNSIQTTISSFDFAYCISVNVLTYLVITTIGNRNRHKDLTTWSKRLILLLVIFFTGGLYMLLDYDVKTLINSAILAPVFWSWIMKPICKRFKIDYRDINLFE